MSYPNDSSRISGIICPAQEHVTSLHIIDDDHRRPEEVWIYLVEVILSVLVVGSTLLSYVPKSVYTVIYFLYLVALVNGSAMTFMIPIVIPKAWVEVVAMGLMMGVLTGNSGFRDFGRRLFSSKLDKSAKN